MGLSLQGGTWGVTQCFFFQRLGSISDELRSQKCRQFTGAPPGVSYEFSLVTSKIWWFVHNLCWKQSKLLLLRSWISTFAVSKCVLSVKAYPNCNLTVWKLWPSYFHDSPSRNQTWQWQILHFHRDFPVPQFVTKARVVTDWRSQ